MTEIIKKRITYLSELGAVMGSERFIKEAIDIANQSNPWFVEIFVRRAIGAIATEMLDQAKLNEWLDKYPLAKDEGPTHAIGIIMAGNIPLVGFHDFLCAYVLGFDVKIKLSDRDEKLFKLVYYELSRIDKSLTETVKLVQRLEGFDAVIATGSDNTNRYFEFYFKQYPSILRKNRNSIAVLTGRETDSELKGLADDIFLYFGFGCRNVSKIYVPEAYDVTRLFPYFESYKWLHQHTKYMNNYDYNRTLLLLNSTPHFSNDYIMLQESAAISSPVSVLYYETYRDVSSLNQVILPLADKIQCLACTESVAAELRIITTTRLGENQSPRLWDYADAVDTINFLLSLKSNRI